MDEDARIPADGNLPHEELVRQLQSLAPKVLKTGGAASVLVPLEGGNCVVIGKPSNIRSMLRHREGGASADAYFG